MAKKRKGFIFKNTVKGTRFPLIDVEEPELFRNVFPYTDMVRVSFRPQDRVDRPPGRDLYHGYDVQGRPAVETPFLRKADRGDFQSSPPVERAERGDTPIRVFPLYRERQGSGREMPRKGIPLSGNYGMDPGEQGRLAACQGVRPERDGHAHEHAPIITSSTSSTKRGPRCSRVI